MATLALFMSPDDKKLTGYVESNYDQDQVASLVYDVQQMHILPLIGTGLYDELETQINAGSLTALNTTLLAKINNAVRMYTLSEGAIIFTYKYRNKGVQTMSGENSQPAPIGELIQLTQRFKNWAQVYAQRVTDYLCENSSSFPLFYNPGDGVDTIHPSVNSYSTGWYLGTETDKYRNNLDQEEEI